MKLFNYKKANNYDVAKVIGKKMELTDYQKEKLPDVIQDLPYLILVINSEKSQPVYRATAPFYLLWAVMLMCFMPLKWIFTGKGYYKYESRVMKFTSAWYKKLGI
jgi:hypothetical protein